MELIRPFERLGKGDAAIAGGKGASLGEMTQAGIPVPPGFVLLSAAFEKFLEEADLNQELDTIFHTVNKEEIRTVDLASERIQRLITDAKMPEDIAREIAEQFRALGTQFVAVRSSATAEDSSSAAWAGQLDTFLNTTEETLLQNVQKCWASLFTPRAIFYRFEKGMHGQKISVAVVVQKMVQSEVSGIAFSVHPVTEDRNQMIIEAGFGLGEAIVSGQVTPDSYVIEKVPRSIIDKNVTYQPRALWRGEGGGNVWRELSEEEGNKPALSDTQALELAELVLKIEQHYGFPCDIEWVFEAGHFFITQSRPITTLSTKLEPADWFDRILHTEWQQDWRNIYTLFGTSLDNQSGKEAYFTLFEKSFGTSISQMLIFFENDYAIAWVPTKEYEELGTYLARKAQDPGFLSSWLKSIRDIYHALSALLELPEEQFLKRFKEYSSLYPVFAPYVIAAKIAFDFLPLGTEDVAKKLQDAREETESFYSRSHSFLHNITASIADKSNYPAEAIRTLTVDEFLQYCKSGTLPRLQTLNDRLSVKGVYVTKGMQRTLTDAEVLRIYESIGSGRIDGDLRGTSAYPGVVTGMCRIVHDFRNVEIGEGEILVTVMTDPSYVPLMKNATAIVTDGGGLLCHAAIVARELKKPCVVGTKFATQLFKDGDIVEVDAEKGIVRKI